MELLVNPASYHNAIDLIEINTDQLIVGSNQFSTRNNCVLTDQELINLISNKKNSKIIILINKLFFEQEIESLTKYLKWISTLAIDGIMFHDFAIPQILFENNISNIPLIYNPETLITSYGQLEFYKDNNFKEVCLARELFYPEILEIGKQNKFGIKLQIQAQGYGFFMDSRWKLISNFEKANKLNLNLKNKKLYLRELTRKLPNLIYEDDNGTHMYTGYQITTINILDKLKEAKIDTLRFDSFFNNEEQILQITKLYQKGLEALKNNSYDKIKNELYEKLLIICNCKISNGFLGAQKDLLHLEKGDDNE